MPTLYYFKLSISCLTFFLAELLGNTLFITYELVYTDYLIPILLGSRI